MVNRKFEKLTNYTYACPNCYYKLDVDLESSFKLSIRAGVDDTAIDSSFVNVSLNAFKTIDPYVVAVCPYCGIDMIELDPQISDIVVRLWRAGIHTFMCCQGHWGSVYGFKNPIGLSLDIDAFNSPYDRKIENLDIGIAAPFIDFDVTDNVNLLRSIDKASSYYPYIFYNVDTRFLENMAKRTVARVTSFTKEMITSSMLKNNGLIMNCRDATNDKFVDGAINFTDDSYCYWFRYHNVTPSKELLDAYEQDRKQAIDRIRQFVDAMIPEYYALAKGGN